jgi:hypothetical protein
MGGFVKSYFNIRHDVKHSRQIMYYYQPNRLLGPGLGWGRRRVGSGRITDIGLNRFAVGGRPTG